MPKSVVRFPALALVLSIGQVTLTARAAPGERTPPVLASNSNGLSGKNKGRARKGRPRPVARKPVPREVAALAEGPAEPTLTRSMPTASEAPPPRREAPSTKVAAFPGLAETELPRQPLKLPDAPASLAIEDEASTDSARRRREGWMLSLEAATHAPVDVAMQIGLELPFGLRASAGYGWVPAPYLGLLTRIAASATNDASAQTLLNEASWRGRTLRVQIGIRPFRALGLYFDAGYSRLDIHGSLDLASTGNAALAALGGGYEANIGLDLWLFEVGYQLQVADRLVLALAGGAMGVFNSKTTIASVKGAPETTLLSKTASQADAALSSYGVIPTLTLRVGFDFI